MLSREFQLINKYFRGALDDSSDVRCGIGDDAAIVAVPPGMELALGMDTLVEGIHFLSETSPEDIGYKSLAVNLSDMAAVGAEPRWISLSLTLPESDESWLQQFMTGFTGLARQYSLSLVGGDLSRGPLTITIQVHGWIPAGQAIYRHGARPHDLVYVSGTLGDAGLALELLQTGTEVENLQEILQRLNRPEPRVELGMALRGIASSSIDISDGLLSDLGHILTASHVAARINVHDLPVSSALKRYHDTIGFAIAAGDDYELCFTAPPGEKHTLEKLAQRFPLTCIGEIIEGEGIQWRQQDGTEYRPSRQAYSHF